MADAAPTTKLDYRSMTQSEALRRFSYNSETGELVWKYDPVAPKWWNTRWHGEIAGYIRPTEPRYVTVTSQRIYAHRVIWAMHFGDIPPGMVIDHINGDGTDNRLANLRLVTFTHNMRNMRKFSTNKTGVTGVRGPNKDGLYVARAWHNGRTLHLGCSKDFATAVAFRKKWERDQGFHSNHGSDRCRK